MRLRNKKQRDRSPKRVRARQLFVEALETRALLTVQPITLADPSFFGISGLKESSNPSISSDGQWIAFQSNADNLVPNDTNGQSDVFIYDRSTQHVVLVSVGPTGMAGGGSNPVISPDGRFVAFESNSRAILPSFPNDNIVQIFLRELSTGTTTLLSNAANSSSGGNRNSGEAVFSADSHKLAFTTNSVNFVSGITYTHPAAYPNIYLRDLATSTTELVSVNREGTTDGDASSGPFDLSADGRFIVFQSSAANLVTIGNNGLEQVYRRDMLAGVTELVSRDVTGLTSSNGHTLMGSSRQAISADGRFVVFNSTANNLVVTPTGGNNNSYLTDMRSGTTVLLSASAVDGSAVQGNFSEVISPDGRWAAFAIGTDNVVAAPTNGQINVYVRNVATGELSLASPNLAGAGGGNDDSGLGTFFDFPGGLSFSPNSRFLAFCSRATDLTSGVATSRRNLYVRDLALDATRLVTPNLAQTDGGDLEADTPVFSVEGNVIAFQSTSSNLVGGDQNHMQDVFVRDMSAVQTELASRRTPLLPSAVSAALGGQISARNGGASADGRYVVFTSQFQGSNGDLIPGVTFTGQGGSNGVYVRDRQTGSLRIVDLDAAGNEVGSLADPKPIITPDGRYVLFRSQSKTLVPGVTYNSSSNLFVRDLQTGTIRIASVNPVGTSDVAVSGDGDIGISDDGRFVLFASNATTPYAGISNPTAKHALFLRDLGDGVTAPTTHLVSRDLANDGQIRGDNRDASLSADGRYVLFTSDDPNLAANDTNNARDVYRWNRTTGLVELVSMNFAGSGPGDRQSNSSRPVMTPDGRYVAFSGQARDLLAVATTQTNVFRRDMQTNTTLLVSTDATGTSEALGRSIEPSISVDGNRVAFTSSANNVTTDASLNFTDDIYVRDLSTNSNLLVSTNFSGTGTASGPAIPASSTPLISRNGRYVAFLSAASDLVSGFVDGTGNHQYNIYLRDLNQSQTKLVSINQSGTASGNRDHRNFRMQFSADDRTLFFDSNATDLFVGDRNINTDVLAEGVAGFSSISGQVFGDSNQNQLRDGSEVGLQYWTIYLDANGNGNLDIGEVNVITDAAGNYSITGLEPGSYVVGAVPQADFLRTQPASSSTYALTIATDGQAITGRDFGEYQSLADLATRGVFGSSSDVAPGETFTFSWTVTNHGTGAAAGDWQDAVYLSPTDSISSESRLVAVVPHRGGLVPGSSYGGMVAVAIPPLPEGDYFIHVQSDYRGQIVEGPLRSNKEDNTAASASQVRLAVPFLNGVSDKFHGVGDGRYYKIFVEAGKTLRIDVLSDADDGSNEIFIRREDYPTPGQFDYAGNLPGQTDQTVFVPQAGEGTYFVYVRTLGGDAATEDFTLNASFPVFGVRSLTTQSGSNQGTVTVGVRGSLFTHATHVELHGINPGGGQIPPLTIPASVQYVDSTLIYATLDLREASGNFDYVFRVQDDGQSISLPFDVFEGPANPAQVTLSVPAEVRFGSQSFVVVDYANTGDTDILPPLITLTADFAVLSLPGQDAPPSNQVQFLGISTTGPAGVLPPGFKGSQKIYFTATFQLSSDFITFQTSIANDTQPMDWAGVWPSLRNNTISPEAWAAILPNFQASVGHTVGSYHQALADNATYLSQLGEYTSDVKRLYSFELDKANHVFLPDTVSDHLDVDFPAPGMRLSFERQFSQPISGRYQVGPLGRGWTHHWQIRADVDFDENVVIQNGSRSRFFSRQADGSFQAGTGDFATLAKVDEVYRLIEPNGTQFVFHPDGTLDYVQDLNRNRITASYTAGRLTSLKHKNNDQITISYNVAGLIHQVTDPAGRILAYEYDADKHLTKFTDRYGTTNYSYLMGESNPAREHALTQVNLPDNSSYFYEYDAFGRLESSHRDNGAEQVTYSFGESGGYTVTDSNDAHMTILYDDQGNPRRVIDPSGRLTQSSFDDNNQETGVALAFGPIVSRSYDADGNLTNRIDAAGNLTQFVYDDQHRLLELHDTKGNVTQYQWDDAGNLISNVTPDGATKKFQYDVTGGSNKVTNRRGQAMNSVRNGRGQISGITFADNSTHAFTYDVHGNLTSATDASGTTTLVYDTRDQIIEVEYPDGYELKYQYDDAGRRTQMVVRIPSQPDYVTNYEYDLAGRLEKVKDGSGGLLVDYTYDDAGRLTRKDLGNGTFTKYEYDAAGYLLHLVHHQTNALINSRFDYTYDELGRVTSVQTLDGTTTYDYDALGQLTSVVLPGGRTIAYQYDAAGNRASVTDSTIGTTAYTVNNRNEYTQVGQKTMSYDADGNLTSQTDLVGTTTYTFNQQNQLLSITSPTDSWSYEYDIFGNRIAATHNGQTTRYLLDPTGLGTVAAELDGSGNLIARYITGLGLVGRIDAGGAAGFYDFDRTGNTTGVTGANGAYSNRYSYLPFGETTTIAAGLPNPFTYVGQQGVMNDGGPLTYMRERYYSASLGAFISDDPMGLRGGDINFRRYVHNNPISFVDPAGLDASASGASQCGANTPSHVPPVHNWPEGSEIPERPKAPAFPEGGPSVEQCDQELPPWIDDLQTDKPDGDENPGVPPVNSNQVAPVPPVPSGHLGPRGKTLPRGSFDPNELIGPDGFGTPEFVSTLPMFLYELHFENDPLQADVAAQDVMITLSLDGNVDWATFQLGDFQFGETIVAVPPGRQAYDVTVDAFNVDGSPLQVEISAGLNSATGVVTWRFHSVDPVTGQVPSNIEAGFLPVNDVTGRGQGSVSYTVRQTSGLLTGATIPASASIVFDFNDAILTNTFVNTIDAGQPTSSVTALPALENANFLVTWTGSDDTGGSGIQRYDIFVSDNGGPFIVWQVNATLLSAMFTGGQAGHTYRFYAVATDNVGNVEGVPALADSQTQVSANLWHNVKLPYDVNHDNAVTPIDALVGINYLNANGPGELPADANATGNYIDTSNDLNATSNDVLRVINFLNANNPESEPAPELAPSSAAVDGETVVRSLADESPLTVADVLVATDDQESSHDAVSGEVGQPTVPQSRRLDAIAPQSPAIPSPPLLHTRRPSEHESAATSYLEELISLLASDQWKARAR